MTQDDKELLLKDLCARLPYKVKCQIAFDEEDIHIETLESVRPTMLFNQVTTSGSVVSIENVKPYLRPMSSMTEEEQIELGKLIGTASYNMLKGDMSHLDALLVHIYKSHIDAFGLIPQGLALEASEGMYNINEK